MLKDRAIFLTGGGTGLGRSMALHLAMLGARIFLIGRREQPLKGVRDEIHRGGGSAAFATCDVRDYGAVETVANLAYEQFGRIDTVINNAAGNFMARTEKLTPNAFNAVVGIVLNGSFHCTQVFAKKWIAEKLGGNVLNIVTTYAAANCGSAFVVPSACAKAGVRHDHVAGCGMGEVPHPAQRYCARSVSHRRCMVASHAFKAIRGARQGIPSDEAVRTA